MRGDPFTLAQQRADRLNVSMCQYIHGLIAADLASDGVVAPQHKTSADAHAESRALIRERHAKRREARLEARRRRAMTAERVIRASAAKPRMATLSAVRVPASPEVLDARDPLPLSVEEGSCVWCGSPWPIRKAGVGDRERVVTELGDMHVGCAREREKIERKHPPVDNRVTVAELAARRIA
jgi:hypothetical protein